MNLCLGIHIPRKFRIKCQECHEQIKIFSSLFTFPINVSLFTATEQQFDIDALNNSLEKVYNWLATNKLSLNIEKN